MADNAFQGTFTPSLPKSAFTEAELAFLEACQVGSEPDGDGLLYFYVENSMDETPEDLDNVDERLVDEVEKLSLDHEVWDIFSNALGRLPAEEYPFVEFEAAYTCSKLRAGEFGGNAVFVTRVGHRHFSTSMWLLARRADPFGTSGES